MSNGNFVFSIILNKNFFFFDKRMRNDTRGVEIFLEHIDADDTPVVVSRVIIDAFIDVATRGIYGMFEAVRHFATAFLLLYRSKNMEKLIYAFGFVIE